jgi:hypothetical protein
MGWVIHLSSGCRARGFDHEVEPVVAEEHLVADEERRKAEHAALGCFGGLPVKPLYVLCPGGLSQPQGAIEAGVTRHVPSPPCSWVLHRIVHAPNMTYITIVWYHDACHY